MGGTKLYTPPGYRILDVEGLRGLVSSLSLRNQLGGDPESWDIVEVGDGNLNLVFLVRGPNSGFAAKQALPYVRLVGDSWPLPLSRSHYEHAALSRQAEHAPGLVPAIYHYDETMALIVMELLDAHIIMRHGMIAGIVYPEFADDISTFLAATHFNTSTLAMPAKDFKGLIEEFAGNTALCKITEDLIFTEPYMVAGNNRWTSPW
ncbi:MAG: S-methyl-5-thioribose kinase, partial [Albidovulum sp.]|nr:S-methyl-5-thioribose kinase [Albidovulum sp.]